MKRSTVGKSRRHRMIMPVFFEEWAERDVSRWIRRDRNHPSVMMWSVGNEIFDMHADEQGQHTLRYLMHLVETHDPKQNAFVTFGSNFIPWPNTQKCADIIKVVGYNYAEKLYEEHHTEHPDWVIYGSETASIVQSRGVYHFPLAKEILADDDEQCSGLGNSITSWGAKSIEFCVTKERDTEYSLGQFLWSGIDYIGEPTPYHGRNSYFGQVDTAGFKKDSFYMYQAGWTSYRENPMVHIFPYWDFNEGQLIDVRVCTNAPEVELLFVPEGKEDAESFGRKKIDHMHGVTLSGDWQIPYRPGRLLAVAFDENGNEIAQDRQESFKDAVKLCIEADRQKIPAEDEELIFVTISTLDEQNRPVHNANNRVTVRVTGAGELVGLDNGDSTDRDCYVSDTRYLFGGKLLAVVRATGETGEIRIEVLSEGMENATLICMAEKAIKEKPIKKGRYKRKENPGGARIPVRKIELLPEDTTTLNAQKKQLRIRAKLYPENADPQELTWRVTDAAGVDAAFASVTPDRENPGEAVVEAKGDGLFYVRCMCKNKRETYALISILEFRAEGLGILNLNPYDFISASLYTTSGGAIGNGNERGISTARDGISFVAFENLDFGEFGSDEVTIPVFSFGETPFTFWEGIPHEEGSRIIGQKEYTLPSIWNTYIPDTFRLNKRLRGITTFAVELDRKIHMKGFQFTKKEKAYERLYAGEADRIYGDSFVRAEKEVRQIGNNVTLVFENMDFGETGTERLTICGKTAHEVNDIRLLTEYEDGKMEQEALEFTFSNGTKEMQYEIKRKKGMAKLSFVFLPGSSFDFEWFCFDRLR